MKKFFNVMKFFVTDEFFLFCLMVVFVFGTIAVINLHALFAVGYNDCIAFSALLYSLLSVVFLVIGIVTTLCVYEVKKDNAYNEHIENLEKSGEWARI